MGAGREGSTVASTAIAVVGVLILAAGIVGGPLGWDVGGVAPFLIVGSALLLVALVHDRIGEIRLQAAGVSVGLLLSRVESQSSKAIVRELERLGVADLTAAYEFVRSEMKEFDKRELCPPAGWPKRVSDIRVTLQDRLIEEAKKRAGATAAAPDKKLLNAALRSNSESGRAIALGVAEAQVDLVTLGALEINIAQSLSGNEQYHALDLARSKLPSLNARQRTRLGRVVEEELRGRGYIKEDDDRKVIAEEILRRIQSGP